MRRIMPVLLSSLLFLLVFTAVAQDLDETYEWDDEGIALDYPDDWDTYVDDNDIVHLASDETDVFIFFLNYDVGDDLDDYVEDAFNEYVVDSSERFDDDEVFFGEIGDYEDTASYFFTDELDGEAFERAIFAIPLTEDLVAIVFAAPLFDDELNELDTVIDILETLRIVSDSSSSGGDVYEFDNGYEIELPDEWETVDDDVFTNGTITVVFEFFDVDDEREDTRARVLQTSYEDLDLSDAYDEDDILFIDLDNDQDAIAYTFEDDFWVILITFMLDDDTIVLASSYPVDEDESDEVLDSSEDFYIFIETLDD